MAVFMWEAQWTWPCSKPFTHINSIEFHNNPKGCYKQGTEVWRCPRSCNWGLKLQVPESVALTISSGTVLNSMCNRTATVCLVLPTGNPVPILLPSSMEESPLWEAWLSLVRCSLSSDNVLSYLCYNHHFSVFPSTVGAPTGGPGSDSCLGDSTAWHLGWGMGGRGLRDVTMGSVNNFQNQGKCVINELITQLINTLITKALK